MSVYGVILQSETKKPDIGAYDISSLHFHTFNLIYDQEETFSISYDATSSISESFDTQYRLIANNNVIYPENGWTEPTSLPHSKTLEFSSNLLPKGRVWLRLESKSTASDEIKIVGINYVYIQSQEKIQNTSMVLSSTTKDVDYKAYKFEDVKFYTRNLRYEESEKFEVRIQSSPLVVSETKLQYRILANNHVVYPSQDWTEPLALPHTTTLEFSSDDLPKGLVYLRVEAKIPHNDSIATAGYSYVYLQSQEKDKQQGVIRSSFTHQPLGAEGFSITDVITPSFTSFQDVMLKFTIQGQHMSRYRIFINETLIEPWSPWNICPYSNEKEIHIPSSYFLEKNLGEHNLRIESMDELGHGTYYETPIETKAINIIQGGDRLFVGRITQISGDDIRYRIFINDIMYQEWSPWQTKNQDIYISWNNQHIVLGGQNIFRIEYEGTNSPLTLTEEYTFLGHYRNLIFSDTHDLVYSDELGSPLEELNLGDYQVGLDEVVLTNNLPIILTNSLGIPLRDIELYTSPEISTRGSRNLIAFNSENPEFHHRVQYDKTLMPGDKIELLVKAEIDPSDNTYQSFGIYAHGSEDNPVSAIMDIPIINLEILSKEISNH